MLSNVKMSTAEWLEDHGFICIKEYDTYKIYQKVDETIILEIYLEGENIKSVELFCNTKDNLFDSMTLV